MRRDDLSALYEKALERGTERRRAIKQLERELDGLGQPNTARACSALEDILMRITTSVERFKSSLSGFEDKRSQAAEFYRAFQHEHNVRRPALKPNLFKSIYIIVLFALIEGVAVGFLMAGEGQVPLVIGLAFGVIFAALNVTVSAAGGFFALRNIFWKTNSERTYD